MKRAVAATVAFYIGILSLIMVVVTDIFGAILNIWPSHFIHFANSWFLIAIVCYLHEIYKKMSGDKKEEKSSPEITPPSPTPPPTTTE
ncbi:hypothetical protein KAW50_08435 [candidate division WOR-3 bacterium]|nr:hypothetical protein [candidate division WOR-3 bacterium]